MYIINIPPTYPKQNNINKNNIPVHIHIHNILIKILNPNNANQVTYIINILISPPLKVPFSKGIRLW